MCQNVGWSFSGLGQGSGTLMSLPQKLVARNQPKLLQTVIKVHLSINKVDQSGRIDEMTGSFGKSYIFCRIFYF